MKDLPKKSFNCVLLLFFSTFLCISLCITMSIQIYLTEPLFSLRHAKLHNFNLSDGGGGGPYLLTTNITVALAAQIPYRHRGIYYDRLDVYASYRNQILTLPAPLPASYQGYNDVAVWSAFLSGNAVPVDPGVGVEVREEQNAGKVLMMNIIVDGRISKRFWNIEVGPCRLSANCTAYLNFGSSSPVQNCHVEVNDYY